MIFAGVIEKQLNQQLIGRILENLTTTYILDGAQIIDNRFIWGQNHVLSAIWHSLNAYKHNRMISNSLSIEILLYSAGIRQIKKAMNLLGVNEITKSIVGVLIGKKQEQVINAYIKVQKEVNLISNLELLNDYSSKRQYFVETLIDEGYSAKELTTSEIEGLILQRTALLAIG